MFRKIISNLPFNPGLIHQLSFYAKRLHAEESVRRTGVIFTLLAIGVQSLAILSPAQVTLATGDGDLVYGAKSKQEIINALTSGVDAKGRADIKQIYEYYGIRLADVQAAGDTTVKSREREYITTGRGDSPGVDVPIQVPGTGTTIYERSLNNWDIKYYENTYPAITGTATGEGKLKGRQFWILLRGCGNITFTPIPKNPKIEIAKTRSGNESLKAGDEVSYRIEFRNSGEAAANNVDITDALASNLEFISQSSSIPLSFTKSTNRFRWTTPALEPSQNWHFISLKVKVLSVLVDNGELCNVATMSATNGGTVEAKNCGVQVTDKYSRIILSKKVSNLTQKIADANNTVAKAGDTLEYTLSVSNTGNQVAANYIIDSDSLIDILEYADLVSYESGSYDKVNQRITWPATTIPASGNITRKFQVKVKSPIPTTPPSLSDPLSFDFKLRNVFGNEVIVNLDQPIISTTYQVTTTRIPNTGPGSSILISLMAVTVIGYFFARSRLLAKEVDIIKAEHTAGV
ncbi:MAG: hypothetical protein AAB624_00200 [Patescibacteria group bacterium]